MSGFNEQQWQAINKKLSQDPMRYGCPIRRNDSVVSDHMPIWVRIPIPGS